MVRRGEHPETLECDMRDSLMARVILLLVATLLGDTAEVFAQQRNVVEGFAALEFNFSTPGARANAMAGAFTGVADDATATITNPAGLMSLGRPQIYFEFAATRLRANRLLAADSLVTAQPTQTTTTVNALSFVSASAPIRDRIVVGFTAHQFLNYRDSFTENTRQVPPDFRFIFLPATASVDYNAWAFAGTVAVELTKTLRAGASVSVNRLDGRSTYTEYAPNGALAGPILVDVVSTNAVTYAPSYAVGLMFRPNSILTVGVNYAKGPTFTAREDYQINPGSPYRTNPTPTVIANLPLFSEVGFPADISIRVPDRLGIGVAARPTSTLLVAVEGARINYSRLAGGIFPAVSTLFFNPAEFTYNDVTEVHAGAEYALSAAGHPLFVRGGVYSSPDHTLKFTGQDRFSVLLYNQLPRKTDVTGTIGAGFVSGTRYQIDVAYAWNKQFVASTAFRF